MNIKLQIKFYWSVLVNPSLPAPTEWACSVKESLWMKHAARRIHFYKPALCHVWFENRFNLGFEFKMQAFLWALHSVQTKNRKTKWSYKTSHRVTSMLRLWRLSLLTTDLQPWHIPIITALWVLSNKRWTTLSDFSCAKIHFLEHFSARVFQNVSEHC